MPEEALVSVRQLKALENSTGHPFACVLLLRRLTTKTASNGNPFLSIELGDRTGTFSCTVFADHPQFELLKSLPEGSAIRVAGKIDYYQGRLSPKLGKLAALSDEELSAPGVLDHLVEAAPEDPEVMWTEFNAFIDAIKHDELRMTARAVFEEIGESFRTAAAAVQMHHAYRHGLLEHTLHMARATKALLPLYPEVHADLAMTGILLHNYEKSTDPHVMCEQRKLCTIINS